MGVLVECVVDCCSLCASSSWNHILCLIHPLSLSPRREQPIPIIIHCDFTTLFRPKKREERQNSSTRKGRGMTGKQTNRQTNED